jgi:cardiolipin synthase (CMP-forming)
MTIPNLITIMRLVLVPVVVVMIGQERWDLAFAIFLVAGVSDAVDGFIARRFDLRSEFGAYIDPLADKALLVSIYVSLAVAGVLPGWIAILVVSRDIMIFAAILVSRLMDRPMEIRPLLVSKLNTAAQIAFAALVLGMLTVGSGHGAVIWWSMSGVAFLTVVSGLAYLGRWLRHMAGP